MTTVIINASQLIIDIPFFSYLTRLSPFVGCPAPPLLSQSQSSYLWLHSEPTHLSYPPK